MLITDKNIQDVLDFETGLPAETIPDSVKAKIAGQGFDESTIIPEDEDLLREYALYLNQYYALLHSAFQEKIALTIRTRLEVINLGEDSPGRKEGISRLQGYIRYRMNEFDAAWNGGNVYNSQNSKSFCKREDISIDKQYIFSFEWFKERVHEEGLEALISES